MIGGGGRYCGGVSIGSMDESTQWQRLRCDEINGENVTAAAVVVWRKRHGSGGWGGGSGGRMVEAARRRQLRCGGRNGGGMVEIAVYVCRKRCGA